MTPDEELSKLDDNIRRLKIEYEAFFNGGMPRPPHETLFRVETTIKKYNDASKLNFGQRFRFNQLVQRYAIHSDLWRKRMREKEEGRGRFAKRVELVEKSDDGIVRVVCSNPAEEKEKVDQLLKAVVDAKRKAGESIESIDPAGFAKFVAEKTRQIRESLGCDEVQFSVSVEDGKVKLKAAKPDS